MGRKESNQTKKTTSKSTAFSVTSEHSWVEPVLGSEDNVCWFLYFDLILYVPSTIFQLYREWSSWVEPVLS